MGEFERLAGRKRAVQPACKDVALASTNEKSYFEREGGPVMEGVRTQELLQTYLAVRLQTEEICRPLETEDYVIQSMPDVSPAKWHLGHTTWFFETFILQKYSRSYKIYNELFGYLFNSYYESIGVRWSRAGRGLLSRPIVQEVYDYRHYVDSAMQEIPDYQDKHLEFLLELGIHHEQQHQELLVTDIKNVLALNPSRPVYRSRNPKPSVPATGPTYTGIEGGLVEIGFGGKGFSFDNERPRHRVWLNDFSLQSRPITNGEYLEFINDGGYRDFRHWLSDGWTRIQLDKWQYPLYWEKVDGEWFVMTLHGFVPLNPAEPVCHVSYFEADAYAKWAGKRLPLESEWEHAAVLCKESVESANFLESDNLHPVPCVENQHSSLQQMRGDVWEWTQSSYLPYPGFKPEPGAVGEYNGKFMNDQMVLRGGSCATPRSHIRDTYRNFFQCDKRWQFTGIRLASDD